MNEYWITDITLDKLQNVDMIYAPKGVARCTGCFGCWLKTPSECVMHDGKQGIGEMLTNRETVRIISKITYGGFSAPVKRVLDRSISGVLPFFSKRHGRMHHAVRYQTKPTFYITFYDCSELSDEEKELAKRAANAMAINMNCKECIVNFIDKNICTLEDII